MHSNSKIMNRLQGSFEKSKEADDELLEQKGASEVEDNPLEDALQLFRDVSELLPQFEIHFANYAHQGSPNAHPNLTFNAVFKKLKKYNNDLGQNIKQGNIDLMRTNTTYVLDTFTQLLKMGIVFARVFPETIKPAFLETMTSTLSDNYHEDVSAVEVEGWRKLVDSGERSGLVPKPEMEEEETETYLSDSDNEEEEEEASIEASSVGKREEKEQSVSYSEFTEEEFKQEFQPYLELVRNRKAKERIDPLIEGIVNLVNQEKLSIESTTNLINLSGQLRKQLKEIYTTATGKSCEAVPEQMMFQAMQKEYFAADAPFKINTPLDESNQQLKSFLKISQELMGIRSHSGISSDSATQYVAERGKAFELCLMAMDKNVGKIIKKMYIEEKDKQKEIKTGVREEKKAAPASKEETLVRGVVDAVVKDVLQNPVLQRKESSRVGELKQVQNEMNEFLKILNKKEKNFRKKDIATRAQIAGAEADLPEYFAILHSNYRNLQRVQIAQKELKSIIENPKLNVVDRVGELRMKFHACILLFDYKEEAKNELKINVEDQQFLINVMQPPPRTPKEVMQIIFLCKDLSMPPNIDIQISRSDSSKYKDVEEAVGLLRQIREKEQALQSLPKSEDLARSERELLRLEKIQLSVKPLSVESKESNEKKLESTRKDLHKVQLERKKIELTKLEINLLQYKIEIKNAKLNPTPGISVKSIQKKIELTHLAIKDIVSNHPKLLEPNSHEGRALLALFKKAEMALSPAPVGILEKIKSKFNKH